jgi:hypothetical protein
MKNWSSVIIVVCIPALCIAQPEKGMFLFSGNVTFQKNADNGAINVTTTKVTQIQFLPYAGYFVSSRIALGVVANYSKNELDYGPASQFTPTKSDQTSFTAGPFIRYYHPITEKFFFFAQGDLTFGKGKGNILFDQGLATNGTITSTSIAVRPGVSYFISKRWAVELILGSLMYSKRDFKGGNTTSSLDGFAISFITRGMSPGVVFTF